MMIRRFTFLLFLVGMIIPFTGYCEDAPPDDFEEIARYAKQILEKNPWVFNSDRISVDTIAYIETTSKRQYKCEVRISGTEGMHFRWIWIGYNKSRDRYYVDVIRSPQKGFVSETIAMVKGLTKQTIRLWERNTPRIYAKEYQKEVEMRKRNRW